MVWHFAPCGHFALRENRILEVAPMDSRGGPHHVYGVAFCSMWHLVPFKDPPDASTIVGYILVNPDTRWSMARRTPV